LVKPFFKLWLGLGYLGGLFRHLFGLKKGRPNIKVKGGPLAKGLWVFGPEGNFKVRNYLAKNNYWGFDYLDWFERVWEA